MTRGISRRAALGLIAGGSVLLIAESRSFSQVNAGRGVSVTTAADPDALLGLTGVTDSETIPTFTNHASDAMEISLSSPDGSAEFDVGNTGHFTSNPAPFSLAVGASEQVGVSGDGETIPVDVVAELRDNGETTGRIELQRDFAVSQAGQLEVSGTVKSSGNSGTYEFGLENTGSIDVTIVGLGINETTEPTATKVGGKNNDDILILKSTKTQLVTSVIEVDSSQPDNSTIKGFEQDVSLGTNEAEKEFEFDRFRTNDNGNAPMNGEEVTITLKFGDDSTKVVELVP